MQALTEDENLRIRKGDIVEMGRSDVVEFFTSVGYYEKRVQQRMEQLNAIRNNGKG